MNGKWFFGVGSCMFIASMTALLAGERPPADAKPLSEITKALEDADVGVITSVEFEDGLWEVQVHKDGRWGELYVDPKTGQIKRQQQDDGDDELPPADGLRLSRIIKSVEDEKLGAITNVEFDDGHWEFKILDGNKRIKLDIDPRTGKKKAA